MRTQRIGLAALVASLVLVTGSFWSGAAEQKTDKKKAPEAKKGGMQAVAMIVPTKDSKVHGMVMFTQMGKKVKVVADISGLTPGSKHGFHVHEYGYCGSADGTCTGGHFDPAGTKHHALPGGKEPHHAGDMGNLEADKEGKAHYEAEFTTLALNGKNSILGRGIVVHAKPDDGGQPTGNAGARLGVGTIGIAKPGE